MKSVSDTDRHLKPAKQEISDVKHRIKIPSNALYLFENDFIEIDVPLNELTIRLVNIIVFEGMFIIDINKFLG